MEPQSLEQLIDCPVCFERLDGSNRVLPCQHTFCKKCLERVKSEFKELRCPECRTKYTGSINDLNCNILVMRILEQIKQSEKEGQKKKSLTSCAKQSNVKTKTDAKSSIQNNERKNHMNPVVNLSTVRVSSSSNDIHARHRTIYSQAETGSQAQPTPSNNNNHPSGNRVILGATRKQNRNRDDSSRNSSTFARSSRSVPSSNANIEPVPHSARENESSTFSPSSYTFTVELKTSDRSLNGNRRTNKSFVKPSVLSTVSNSNVIITTPVNSFNNFSATNTNVVTPSTSQPVVSPKNYLSFNPGSYTFNVNLKSSDRGGHKKKNYLS